MTMTQERVAAFLARSGWDGARFRALAGDASARSYLRLSLPERGTAVLMDAPPETAGDTGPFVEMAEHLLRHGFSAPRILAHDRGLGLVLVEDLGDDLYARLCRRNPAIEPTLYAAAVDLLVRLRETPLPERLGPYDRAARLRESRLLCEWYLPAATGCEVPADVMAAFDMLIDGLSDLVDSVVPCLVLRDYHAENLLWLPGRQGIARVGLLDFQDALAGHPAYDLVSLLEDARRDTSAELRAAMLARYLDATGLPRDGFLAACAALGAQRNLKIIGIFARLCRRDGKRDYLPLVPRVWGHLVNDLSHPLLAALRDWVLRHVPAPDDIVLARIREAP